MFRKKETSEKITKKRRTKYVYDPEYLSARKKKRITLTTIFLCVSLLFSNIYLKANYKEEYIEYVLEKSFYDDFEYLGLSGTESWFTDTKSYRFESKNFPNQSISVCVYDNFVFWNFKKWRSNYLSVKYKKEAEEQLKELFFHIYGDCQIHIVPGVIKSKYNIQSLSFEKYMACCLDDSRIQLITTNSLESRDEDVKLLIDMLQESYFEIDCITIYYVNEKLDNSLLEQDQIAKSSILYGTLFIDEHEIKSINWHN